MTMTITIKSLGGGSYGIYKNGRKISEESSRWRAEDAAKWYRNYFRGGVSKEVAHQRFQQEEYPKSKPKSYSEQLNQNLSNLFRL